MRLTALAAVAVLALAGCGSSAPVTKVATSTPTPKPSTYYSETATVIASQIKGCADVKAGEIGAGSKSGMASTATCMLNGRTVTINSWTTVEARDIVNAVLKANKVEVYFAQGEGWTVTPADDPALQLQMTNDAAALLANSFAGKTAPPPDIPGQKASADAIVASLNGTVVHIQP